jgi:hypothetical protein
MAVIGMVADAEASHADDVRTPGNGPLDEHGDGEARTAPGNESLGR